MIGRANSNTSGDRSFLCLLAIYAAHVILFHVLDGTNAVRSWPLDNTNYYNGIESVRRTNGSSSCCKANVTTAAKGTTTATTTTSTTTNNGANLIVDDRRNIDDHGPSNLLTGQLGRKVFTSSNQFQKQDTIALLMTYPKLNLDFLLSASFVHRMKNIFTTVALSSPTWGILSGCIIFLLTYTDRDNTLAT